jgi:CHASE3 domain sensor protein
MTYQEIRDIINNTTDTNELQDIINQLSEALKNVK